MYRPWIVTLKRATETLLLAAHGSSRPGADNPVIALSERLKALEVFADVRYGFLKQEPLLASVLADIQTPDLVVVPMLSGNGYITDTLIPDPRYRILARQQLASANGPEIGNVPDASLTFLLVLKDDLDVRADANVLGLCLAHVVNQSTIGAVQLDESH